MPSSTSTPQATRSSGTPSSGPTAASFCPSPFRHGSSNACPNTPVACSARFHRPAAISALLQTGAITAGFLLLTFLVRWYFHDGNRRRLLPPRRARHLCRQRAAVPPPPSSGSAAFTKRSRHDHLRPSRRRHRTRLHHRRAHPRRQSPLTGENVGTTRVFNDLLYVYGIPAPCAVRSHGSVPAASERSKLLQNRGSHGMASYSCS